MTPASVVSRFRSDRPEDRNRTAARDRMRVSQVCRSSDPKRGCSWFSYAASACGSLRGRPSARIVCSKPSPWSKSRRYRSAPMGRQKPRRTKTFGLDVQTSRTLLPPRWGLMGACGAARFQGLTPLATYLRPFGAIGTPDGFTHLRPCGAIGTPNDPTHLRPSGAHRHPRLSGHDLVLSLCVGPVNTSYVPVSTHR